MLKVISNTTSLIALLKIGRLEFLRQLYGEIIIPNAVLEEINKGKNKPYYTDFGSLDWIKVMAVQDKKALLYFIDLDAGEAEVIVLANEIEADVVIIDETLGRRYASNADLKVTGTMGVLIKAKERGYIDKVKPLLDLLQEKGIWIGSKLREKILSIIHE
jgi:uncharacterized protein